MSDHKTASPPSADMAYFGIDPRLQACMGEIGEVLCKHGLEGRVGLSILHRHFPVDDDEILFESNNPRKRELRFQTVKKKDLEPEDVFVSTWDPYTGQAWGCCPRTHQCHQILEDPVKWELI